MRMATITSIFGMEPAREREFPVCFAVGHDGVTKIVGRDENFGDHGIGWFDVWCGDKLVASMSKRAVSQVTYLVESDAP